jgi:formylglycine-generating enzyme required for sulfatase activity
MDFRGSELAVRNKTLTIKIVFLLMIFALLFATTVLVVSADDKGINGRPKDRAVPGSPAALDSAVEGERVLRALIIGINRFQDGKIRELSYCRSDADGLTALVADRRYTPFDRVEATTLLDREATKERVRAALEDLGRTSDPQDTVIVYFSSHGIQQDQGEAYWVLHDSHVDMGAYKSNRLRVDPETALVQSEITRLLNGIRAKRLLVLVDSCFSAATVISYPRGKSFKSRKVKNPFDSFKGEGRVVITASEGKQMAAELPQLGHGAFTYFLLEGLKGKADSNFDNVVELWEIWQYLDKKVTDAVHNAGGDQRPTISSVHLTHGFPLTTYPLNASQVAASIPGKTDPSAGETPGPGWVTINRKTGRPLYMSPTETTNRQYLDFVTANPKWRKDRIPIHYQDGDYLKHWPVPNAYPKGMDNHPVTYVSWFAAKAFAEWAGARLPLESEWTMGASGTEGSGPQTGRASNRLYPWGNHWNPAACNHRSNTHSRTAPVHSFEQGGSRWPDGVIYNLSGNVWEWCSDWVFEYTTPSGTRGIVVVPVGANKKPEINRLIKGGSFMADRVGCMIASKVWADPRLCAEDGGFRVVKD